MNMCPIGEPALSAAKAVLGGAPCPDTPCPNGACPLVKDCTTIMCKVDNLAPGELDAAAAGELAAVEGRLAQLRAPPLLPLHALTTLAPVARAGGTYWVVSQAVVGGVKMPVSNPVTLTMPGANAPALIHADDTSSTTGEAVAVPPPGKIYDMVRALAPAQRRG